MSETKNHSLGKYGVILEAPRESEGLLGLAYPVKSFEAMRLASRFSKAQIVNKGASGVVIRWDKLGASRPNLALPTGSASAVVTIPSRGRCKIGDSNLPHQ